MRLRAKPAKISSDGDAFIRATYDAMSASQAMVWYDPKGKIRTANTLFCELTGYKLDDLIGLPHETFVAPDRRNTEADKGFRDALSGQTPPADVVPRVSKHGDTFHLQVTYMPMLSESGVVNCIVQTATEVSETCRAMINARAQFDAISASHGRLVYATDGTILEANDNALDLLGYDHNELVGQSYAILVHPEYAHTDRYDAFMQDVQSGAISNGLFRRFRKDGEARWFQSLFCPEQGPDGKVRRLISVIADVTENTEANDMTIVLSKVQAVIEFSPDGTIRRANNIFLDAMGYELEDIVGQHRSIFLPDDEADKQYTQDHWRMLQDGQLQSGDCQYQARDGTEVWMSANYVPVFGPKGAIVKVVQYATIITSRVKVIKLLRDALAELAVGNLQYQIAGVFDADFEPIKTDFNAAISKLRNSLGGVVRASSQIGVGTQEISTASDDLSRRTEHQAASLEETATAISEMSHSVNSTAKIAAKTHALVDKTQSRARASSSVMEDAHKAMGAISASSDEISTIINVIDGIAFQTNLLALNAGVEAARAGDAGRGFAIVASEVRALAQRSAEAATQIAQLISTSVEQVDQGVSLVSKTGQALAEIEAFVTEVSTMVSEIAGAADKQSGGLEEITVAISALDDVTQKNAAMFQETNTATRLLAKEVESLEKLTDAFALSDEQPPAQDLDRHVS